MKTWFRRWGWPVGKTLLALAILVGVGRQFYTILRDLDLSKVQISWSWVGLSAGLYLLGLGFSGCYWYRLLKIFGEKPTLVRSMRAYYIGHLGKYAPGKAWALLLRALLVHSRGVRLGVAILTSYYEVLTTMATGALVAAIVFALDPPQVAGMSWNPLFTGLLLLGLVGVPLLPGVFNFMVSRLARHFQHIDSFKIPKMRGRILVEGLLLIACGWIFLGASLWAMLASVLPDIPILTPVSLAQFSAIIGLGYVAGFLFLVMPGGIGIREYFLLNLLKFAGAEDIVLFGVLLLRLVWTSAELILAGLLYPLRTTSNNHGQP